MANKYIQENKIGIKYVINLIILRARDKSP
jgi:hypothetical protein